MTASAMNVLKARLYEKKQDEQRAEMDKFYGEKGEIGFGAWPIMRDDLGRAYRAHHQTVFDRAPLRLPRDHTANPAWPVSAPPLTATATWDWLRSDRSRFYPALH